MLNTKIYTNTITMLKIEERRVNGELVMCKCYYYKRKDNGNMNCRQIRPIRPRKPRSDKGLKREKKEGEKREGEKKEGEKKEEEQT